MDHYRASVRLPRTPHWLRTLIFWGVGVPIACTCAGIIATGAVALMLAFSRWIGHAMGLS